MASPYTDAPPDYEDLDFNEVVSELEHAHLSAIDAQQTQAAMHQAVSSADQQAAIYKEISGVSVNSRALQKEFRSAENEFSRSQQVPKGSFDQLKGCSELYTQLLWGVRDGASRTKGIIDQFNASIIPIIKDPECPMEDAQQELLHFIKENDTVQSSHSAEAAEAFTKLEFDLDTLKQVLEQAKPKDQVSNPSIVSAQKKVDGLASSLEKSKANIERMRKAFMKAVGFELAQAVVFVIAPYAMFALMAVGAAVTLSKKRQLEASTKRAKGLQEQLEKARTELQEKVAAQKGDTASSQSIDLLVATVADLKSRILDISPKLAALSDVFGSVKKDVEDYLSFLDSPHQADQLKKEQAIQKMEISGALYTQLAKALGEFSAVVA